MLTWDTNEITLLKSIKPAVVAKRFSKASDGAVKKQGVANVYEGACHTVRASGVDDLVEVLHHVTSSTDICIIPGSFAGAVDDEQFDLVTEKTLAELAGSFIGDVAGGVHTINDRRVAARLKRGINPSEWLLLDADNPEGIPPEWAAMDIPQRLAMLEPLLPGVSRCERIELRSSSARVVNGTDAPGKASHAWVRVDRPDLIEMAKASVQVRMVTAGLSFPSPRYSRKIAGKVIGHEHRTVIDLSVWTTGRIVFNARPVLGEGMDGYNVADPDIRVVNRGAGPLRLAWAEQLPNRADLSDYTAKTGQALSLKVTQQEGRVSVSVEQQGMLTLETEITSKGVTKPLREWLEGIEAGGKLRCEAPFRASESEAALIRKTDSGHVLVYDVGNQTTYHLTPDITDCFGDETAGDKHTPNIMPIQAAFAEPLNLDYVVQHILVKGWLYALTANPGSGKTAVSLYMAAMLALGKPFMGRKTVPCKVLFLCGENPQDVRIRTEVMLLDMGIPLEDVTDRIYFTRRPFAIDNKIALIGFVNDVQQHGPFDMMFIDTGPAHSKADDENDNRAMHELAIAMRDLMGPLGMPCTVALMHPVKNATRDNLLPRGGSSFTGSIDGALCLWREGQGSPSELFPHRDKFRGQHFAPLWFDLAQATHPTARDNFGDEVQTVIAKPGQRELPAVDVPEFLSGRIREDLLDFIAAVEAAGEWIGTSTNGPAANNPFRKSWTVHPAYPACLLNADEAVKRVAYREINEMVTEGLLVREARAVKPDQRQRDWPNGVWLTQKGREALSDSLV
jgi:hypothetical protein